MWLLSKKGLRAKMIKFIDISTANTGESVFKNGVYQKTLVHDFDWSKAIAKGVTGAIIKCSESTYDDISYETLMGSCPLDYAGVYHFMGYSQKDYPVNGEFAYADDQTQKVISQVDKYRRKINVRIAIDNEQNFRWESLTNTNEDYVINRNNKILLRICMNILKEEGYWPIDYTNRFITSLLNNNFTNCPLWIAMGNETLPTYNTATKPNPYKVNFWKKAAIRQTDWNAPGRDYGNYVGNPDIDINIVDDLDAILIKPANTQPTIPTPPVIEDSQVYPQATVICWLGVKVRLNPGINYVQVGSALPFSLLKHYDVLETRNDTTGHSWVRIAQGWVCVKYNIQLLKIS